jgi:hypothetical protein
MVQLSEFWDVGEDLDGKRWPNLGKTSTARVMQALLRLDGKMTDSYIEGDDGRTKEQHIGVVYRITLPVGRNEEFEEMTGYRLTRPGRVGVN